MNVTATIPKKYLEELYFIQDKTMKEIANELGKSYKFVFYLFKKLGIPSKVRFSDYVGKVSVLW